MKKWTKRDYRSEAERIVSNVGALVEAQGLSWDVFVQGYARLFEGGEGPEQSKLLAAIDDLRGK